MGISAKDLKKKLTSKNNVKCKREDGRC